MISLLAFFFFLQFDSVSFGTKKKKSSWFSKKKGTSQDPYQSTRGEDNRNFEDLKGKKNYISNFSVYTCYSVTMLTTPERYKLSAHFLPLNVFNYYCIPEGFVGGYPWNHWTSLEPLFEKKGSGWLSFGLPFVSKMLQKKRNKKK